MPRIVIEDCALAYFLSTYLPGSHFDYLSDLLNKVEGDSALAKAACASAMANFSAEHGDATILPAARRMYTEALQLTNKAVSKPVEAAKDETLAAVLLLSLFEAFMHEGRRVFPKNWTAHTEGAGALLQLRGSKQFETEIGSLLFSHVSANIRVSAAIRRLPLPPDFDRLYNEAMQHYHGSDHLWRLGFLKLVESFAMIRYEVDQRLITNSKQLIAKLLNLEERIVDNMTRMPEQWHYTTSESTEVSNGLWLEPIHYANAKVAQVWDSVRMMRLFLNEAIHHVLSGDYHLVDLVMDDLGVESDSLLISTAKTCEQMARQICAGIPNYLHSSSSPSGRIVLAEASWLLWPLSVAGECHYVSDEVRQFAITQLQSLGQDTRLPQALWAAEMLKERSEDEEWYGFATFIISHCH